MEFISDLSCFYQGYDDGESNRAVLGDNAGRDEYNPAPFLGLSLTIRHTKEPTMSQLPPCPQCQSPYAYEDGSQLVCPECGHEWQPGAAASSEEAKVIRDSAGNVLQDGDTVTVIKDLKVKGSSLVVKIGTKVKGIRLVEGDHDIDCKIDGFGAMKLKSEFVKKV